MMPIMASLWYHVMAQVLASLLAYAPMAQLVGRLSYTEEITGSSPVGSTCGVEKFGRSRVTHNHEIAGSNPAPATVHKLASLVLT